MHALAFGVLATFVAASAFTAAQTNVSGANFTATVKNSGSTFTAAQLAAPTQLAGTASASGVSLTWTAGDSLATSYKVFAASLSGTTCGTFAQIGTSPGTAYTDATHTGGECYEVFGVVGGWTSAVSNVAQVAAYSGMSCSATWAITTVWNTSTFQATVTVKNTGSAPTSSWQLGWTWPGSGFDVSNWTNANGSQNGLLVTAVNLTTDAVIAAGGTVALTLNIDGNSTQVPTLPIDCGPRHPLPGGACTATYTNTYDWGAGFTATVTVKNTGTITTDSWTVTWTWSGNQQISGPPHDAAVTQTGKSVTAINLDYNGQLTAGGSTSFGFNGSYSGTNTNPTLTCVPA